MNLSSVGNMNNRAALTRVNNWFKRLDKYKICQTGLTLKNVISVGSSTQNNTFELHFQQLGLHIFSEQVSFTQKLCSSILCIDYFHIHGLACNCRMGPCVQWCTIICLHPSIKSIFFTQTRISITFTSIILNLF